MREAPANLRDLPNGRARIQVNAMGQAIRTQLCAPKDVGSLLELTYY